MKNWIDIINLPKNKRVLFGYIAPTDLKCYVEWTVEGWILESGTFSYNRKSLIIYKNDSFNLTNSKPTHFKIL